MLAVSLLFTLSRIVRAHAGKVAVAGVLAAAAVVPAQATNYANLHPMPVEVDVALVLAVDVSQSMDEDEQKIQRSGYVEALTSKEVLDAIRYGIHGRIAVTYVEWGSEDAQEIVAPWTIVDGPASAARFAAMIGEAPIQNLHRTSISNALVFAASMIETSGFKALRRVIDISGDGPNNQGPMLAEAREMVTARGITINGLPLLINGSNIGWQAVPELDRYYEDCVIGGPGSFSIAVNGLENFNRALKMKLVLEIAGLTYDEPRIIKASGRKKLDCKIYE